MSIVVTNVVPFKPRPTQHVLKVKAVTVFIDDSRPLREGDLVAWTILSKTGDADSTMFSRWYPPAEGRDINGRFCKKGSKDELWGHLDFFKYSQKDVETGPLKIFGRVIHALAT